MTQANEIPIILTLLYVIIFVLVAAQLLSICNLPNKFITFRNSILFTLLVESVIRIIYWIFIILYSNENLPQPWFRILYYFPVWLNFAGLSLLCAFYAKASMQRYNSSLPLKVCGATNFVFLVLNVSFAWLEGKDKVLQSVYVGYAVFLDALTAICVGYFGSIFVRAVQTKRNWMLPRSVQVFNTINWIIAASFLLRSILVATLSFELFGKYDIIYEQGKSSWTMLAFFSVTEWVPNLLMIYLLWHPTADMTITGEQSNVLQDSLLKGEPTLFVGQVEENRFDSTFNKWQKLKAISAVADDYLPQQLLYESTSNLDLNGVDTNDRQHSHRLSTSMVCSPLIARSFDNTIHLSEYQE